LIALLCQTSSTSLQHSQSKADPLVRLLPFSPCAYTT
jgi:hypothetical protein